MAKQRDIGREFDTYIKVKLENQKQVHLAEELGVTPPTIHKWLANAEKELEKVSTLQRILELVGNIERAAEIMDVPVAAIDAHLSGDMIIVPTKIAHLIVEEGLIFDEICDEAETNLPHSQSESDSQDTTEIVDVEPAEETTKEEVSTEDLFESLHKGLKTMQDNLKTIQQRIFTEDDLLSFLESKRKSVKGSD